LTGDVGCVFSKQVEIKSAEPGTELLGGLFFTAPFNQPFPLPITWKNSPVEITWVPDESLSCSDCLQPTFTGTAGQQYTIVTFDSLGCRKEFNLEVIVPAAEDDIIASNVLTLNDDGTNDFFVIQSLGSSILESFVMLDRWGNVVFEGNQQLPGKVVTWNGSFGSKSVTPGVYVYVVTTSTEGKKRTRSGNLTVLR